MERKWRDQSTRSSRRTQAVSIRLLLSLCCYFFLTGLMQTLVSLRGVEAGLGGVNLGLALGLASGSAGAFLDVPVGAWADRAGRRRVARIGLLCSLAAAVMLLFNSQILLIFGALFAGLGVILAGAPLLSWLSCAAPPRQQARLQGINSSAQRIGALLAVAAVGIALGIDRLDALSLGAAIAVGIGLFALGNRVMRGGDLIIAGQPASAFAVVYDKLCEPRSVNVARHDEALASSSVLTDYAAGLRMVVQRPILLAGAINLAINVIFLTTNSYVPLVEGPDRTLIVICTLISRDLVAVLVGVVIAVFGISVTSPGILGTAFALAGLATWLLSNLTAGPLMVCAGGVQGIALGVGIAAANLFASSGTPARTRTLAMAASFLQGRVMFFLLPIGCSLVLTKSGLQDVFRLLGFVLLAVSLFLVALGRAMSQENRSTPRS